MAPPTFMGLSGQPLSLAVSSVATTGFLLFGYDQGYVSSRLGYSTGLTHSLAPPPAS